MIDYNQTLTPGDVEMGIINVVVEIPIGGFEKIEWKSDELLMKVDRVNPIDFPEPINYGFIPQTLNQDRDNLDVFIVSDSAIPTGTILQAKIIGMMKFEDEGLVDDKIIVVPVNSEYGNNKINFITDLPSRKIDEIMYYYSHYKDQANTSPTDVKGWGNISEAKAIIYQAIDNWNKNKK